MTVTFKIPRLESKFEDYDKIVKIHHDFSSLLFEEVHLDFSDCTWIDANLTAVLGAILDGENGLNDIKIINLNPKQQTILQKNDFLSNYGYQSLKDSYNTTIKYKKFRPLDEQIFYEYLQEELFTKNDLPQMSKSFSKNLALSLSEIFVNANMHGLCKHVYTCGQYFPGKNPKMDFTIVDIGKTIKKNVFEYFQEQFKQFKTYSPKITLEGIHPAKAIDFAVKGNSTLKGHSGGAGLPFVREFVAKNKGRLQIISDSGFWEQNVDGIILKKLNNSFKGTIVNFEINMEDNNDY